jgi:hypothetical protein
MSRQSVELAGTAIGAVAVDELTPMNRPVDHLQLLLDGDHDLNEGLSTIVAMHGSIRPRTDVASWHLADMLSVSAKWYKPTFSRCGSLPRSTLPRFTLLHFRYLRNRMSSPVSVSVIILVG